MKRFDNLFTALCLITALTGCSSKSDSHKQARQNLQKTVDEIKTASDSLKPAGGQPGAVSLSGAFIDTQGNLIETIKVELSAGRGWKGTAPKVDANKLTLRPEVSNNEKTSFESARKEKTYINLGCSLTAEDVGDLQEQVITDSTLLSNLWVNTVFACGKVSLPPKKDFVNLTARKLILADAEINLVGTLGTIFMWSVEELELNGMNKLISKAPDGPSTLLAGPNVGLSAATISGDGTLSIIAEGSNYVAKEEK